MAVDPSSTAHAADTTEAAALPRTRVVLLCAAVAMLDGFDTQATAFVAPVIAGDWGIGAQRLGVIFSSGLVGIMLGQLTLGPLSDRYGRRPIILLSTALFGIGSLATTLADGWISLLILRFLTGIGLGGATPNILALTAEAAPGRMRSTMVTTMFAGFPLGAALGGLLSARLIPAFGWQSVFVAGGVAPILLLFVLLPALPESLHRNRATLPRERTRKERTAYRALFAGRLKAVTPLLWLAYFDSLLVIYFLFSWLPTLARQAGLPLDMAIAASVFLNVGGAGGGILLGYLADRWKPFTTICAGFLLAAAGLVAMGLAGGHATPLLASAFLAGLCALGCQTAMNAAATGIYPDAARGTGLGAALSAGRIGSILGPAMGGTLLSCGWSLSSLFTLVGVLSLLNAGVALRIQTVLQARTPP